MRKLIAVFLVGALAGTVSAAVSINEVRIDQDSTDNDEYFELHGTPYESLDNLWYIVIGDDSNSGAPASRSGSIESVTPLAGSVIPADGFFLCVEDTYTLTPPTPAGAQPLGLADGTPDLSVGTGLNFENSDNVTHMLVEGFTGAINDVIDTNRDGYFDVFPWTSIVDAVSLIEIPNGPGHTPPTANDYDEWDYSEDPGAESDGVGPDGSYVPGHIGRVPDGKPNQWFIGGFSVAVGVQMPDDTPGYSNVPEPATLALFAIGGLALLRRR